jgi:hypothetical protein
MKRVLALFFAVVLSSAVAKAGDLKVDVTMTTAPGGEETSSFAPDAPKIFAIFKTKGAQNGDKIRGLWIPEDVGDAAPANSKIDEKSVTLEGDTDDGRFSLSKNMKSWPAGKYRLEIYVNDSW